MRNQDTSIEWKTSGARLRGTQPHMPIPVSPVSAPHAMASQPSIDIPTPSQHSRAAILNPHLVNTYQTREFTRESHLHTPSIEIPAPSQHCHCLLHQPPPTFPSRGWRPGTMRSWKTCKLQFQFRGPGTTTALRRVIGSQCLKTDS